MPSVYNSICNVATALGEPPQQHPQGASLMPIVWKKILKFQKSLTNTKWWINISLQWDPHGKERRIGGRAVTQSKASTLSCFPVEDKFGLKSQPGALPTPNIWEKRPKFQKNLSYTEWWVDMSFQFTKAQRRLPIGARDGVGQEHGCVLYPQSLESESSTKPVDIELNQNNTHEENLCHKSNARGDCPLNENGSILMPDGPIQVAYLIEVPDKSLVDKTLRKTNNQSKLLKNDCLGSHLGRAELNYSNTEQPLFESTSSSGKESVLTIYPDKLGSEFFESRDNISVCSTIIHFEDLASYCLRAPKYSNRHKDGSLASCGSFDDGNIHVKGYISPLIQQKSVKHRLDYGSMARVGTFDGLMFIVGESSRKKEPFSLKRSNDSSVSISCKKQKITEEIGAQVLSALSEGSISASSSLIDLNTPDLKISHIDTQKMPLTHSPADPECWQNVIVPPSDHPDIVSLKGNFPLISKHTDGNKCTLERDDAQNISFLETDFINRNESLKRTHMPDCNLNDGMSEINTYETRKVIKYNIIPCDVKKRDCSPEYTKEIISKGKHIIPFESSSFTHRYAISGKPLKLDRSKLKKLRNNSKEKVTDLMSEESSVCLENNIFPKHINRPSDLGLYLMNESEQSIDKGEKQPNKQRRYNSEEVENNVQKISEILEHENRTKPSTPISMISTESNSQLSKLKNSELYLMNESEQSIDKGGKQPNKQRRSTCEEVEKNDQKISKILDHEDRTKPSTPNPMISTKSNSQLYIGEKQPNKQRRSTCEEVEKNDQKISKILDHEEQN
uniref:Uncharacterized protein n=1 Tax=Timema douglasi TaxID=61478 RepID=A0A7R8VNT0_TIMDO|nr:unnamed protein product [Timema douglasi]